MMRRRYRPSTYSIRKSMPEFLPYLVEPMTLADIDQVIEIERVSFPAPWSARTYRYEITENKNSTMLVVRPIAGPSGRITRLARHLGLVQPSPVLGYAGFWLLVDEAHICTIAVHPTWRGRGLGELLIFSLLERGVELGAFTATLEVRVSNQVAQELYRKYLFEIVSRRKRYYSDNNEDAFIMTTPPLETSAFQRHLDRCRAQLHARLQAKGEDLRIQAGSIGTSGQNRGTGAARKHGAG
jgi:ribosomal-protein-alanine N-acetyltransferase